MSGLGLICRAGCVSYVNRSRRLRQREPIQTARERFHEPVGDEAVEGAGPLNRLVPHAVQDGLRDRGDGLPEYGEELAADLAVRTGVRLAAARRTLVLGLARQPPRALRRDRAAVAGLVLRRADECAQLHGGGGPAGGRPLAVGQQRTGELALGGRRRVRGVPHAGDRAREDPSHVRVQYGVTLAVRERRHRRRRVLADAGQREQLRVLRGYVAAVPFRYGHRGAVQAQRAAGVAEAAPGADRFARWLLGQVGGAGPAGQPLLVHGQHAVHRRLLQHELADHHAPGAGVRAAPREVAGVRVEPGDDGGVQGLAGGGGRGGLGVGFVGAVMTGSILPCGGCPGMSAGAGRAGLVFSPPPPLPVPCSWGLPPQTPPGLRPRTRSNAGGLASGVEDEAVRPTGSRQPQDGTGRGGGGEIPNPGCPVSA